MENYCACSGVGEGWERHRRLISIWRWGFHVEKKFFLSDGKWKSKTPAEKKSLMEVLMRLSSRESQLNELDKRKLSRWNAQWHWRFEIVNFLCSSLSIFIFIARSSSIIKRGGSEWNKDELNAETDDDAGWHNMCSELLAQMPVECANAPLNYSRWWFMDARSAFYNPKNARHQTVKTSRFDSAAYATQSSTSICASPVKQQNFRVEDERQRERKERVKLSRKIIFIPRRRNEKGNILISTESMKVIFHGNLADV